MPSAAGERQMLPLHTKSMRILLNVVMFAIVADKNGDGQPRTAHRVFSLPRCDTSKCDSISKSPVTLSTSPMSTLVLSAAHFRVTNDL